MCTMYGLYEQLKLTMLIHVLNFRYIKISRSFSLFSYF